MRLLGPSNDDTLNAADGIRKIIAVKNPAGESPRKVRVRDLFKQPDLFLNAPERVTEVPTVAAVVVPSRGETGPNTSRSFGESMSRKSIPDELDFSSSGQQTSRPIGQPDEAVGQQIPVRLGQLPEDSMLSIKSADFVFPQDSLFGEYLAKQGFDEFRRALSELDINMLHYTDFDISTSFPRNVPAGSPAVTAMQLVYLKRMQSIELEDEGNSQSDPMMLERFFKKIKQHQSSVKYVFTVLNSIHREIAVGNNTILTLESFSSFINSETENVHFMDYFTNVLLQEKPDVIDVILDELMEIKTVVEINLEDFLRCLQCEFKSIQKILYDINQIDKPNIADVSAEANILREAIRLRKQGDIQRLRDRLELRIKYIAEGMSVLVDGFKITQDEIVEKIDLAVDRFEEFWSLLKLCADGEESPGTDPPVGPSYPDDEGDNIPDEVSRN